MLVSRALVALAVIGAMAVGPAAAANAGEQVWDAPVSVSATAGQNALFPQIATDGDRVTAVWARYDDDDSSRGVVESAFSTDKGATWSSPTVLSEAGKEVGMPQVVTDGNTVTAIWLFSPAVDGVNSILSASSTDGGATWSSPVSISDDVDYISVPHLVTEGDTVTAVWSRTSYSPSGSSGRVQSAFSSDGGITWSAPVSLSDAREFAGDPQVAADGSAITAVWNQRDGRTNRIQSAFSIDGGATWSAPAAVAAAHGSSYPQVAADGGIVTVLWFADDDSGDTRVQSASSTDGGGTWGTPVSISNAGKDSFNPRVVSVGGTIAVVWQYLDERRSSRIESAVSTDGGSTWTTPVALTDPSEDVYSDHAQVTTDGTIVTAVWQSDSEIRSAFSTDKGVTWSAPVSLSGASAYVMDPQVVTDGGTVTALWSAMDGSNFAIQSSSFSRTAEPESEPEPGPVAAEPAVAEPELAATGPANVLGLGLLAAGMLGAGMLLARARRIVRA